MPNTVQKMFDKMKELIEEGHGNARVYIINGVGQGSLGEWEGYAEVYTVEEDDAIADELPVGSKYVELTYDS